MATRRRSPPAADIAAHVRSVRPVQAPRRCRSPRRGAVRPGRRSTRAGSPSRRGSDGRPRRRGADCAACGRMGPGGPSAPGATRRARCAVRRRDRGHRAPDAIAGVPVTLSEASSDPSVITPAAATAPVTVAVVSWNTRELLAECLSSLERDARGGIADVWVVDNASDDGSADLVERRFEWVSLIRSSRNLGFGPAVNLVAARTSSAWLAPANADVRITEGALRRLLAEGDRHPEAAVIAPRLLLPDGETQHSVYPFPSLPFTIAYLCGAVTARSEE